MMKLLASVLLVVLAPSTVTAAAGMSPIVECSKLSSGDGDDTFEACGTVRFTTPSPAMIDNETFYMGGYTYTFAIVKGLKDGADTSTLSKAELKKAYSPKTTVTVKMDDNETCAVVVQRKDRKRKCSSCSFCGEEKYSANCTNLPMGRNVVCESVEIGDVFFPLNAAALSLPQAPTSMVVKPPVVPENKAPRAPAAPGQKPPTDDNDGENKPPRAPRAPTAGENGRSPAAPGQKPPRDDDNEENKPPRAPRAPTAGENGRAPVAPGQKPPKDDDNEENKPPRAPRAPVMAENGRAPAAPGQKPPKDDDDDENKPPKAPIAPVTGPVAAPRTPDMKPPVAAPTPMIFGRN